MPLIPLHGSIEGVQMEDALRYYHQVYDMTNAILAAMERCQLGREYWFSTKDHSVTAVIHCEEYCWLGNIRQVTDALKGVKTADQFWAAIEKVCRREEYPWVQFKDGHENAR